MGIVLIKMLCFFFLRTGPDLVLLPFPFPLLLFFLGRSRFFVLRAPHRKKPRIPCATCPRRDRSTLDHLFTLNLFGDVDGSVENLDKECF